MHNVECIIYLHHATGKIKFVAMHLLPYNLYQKKPLLDRITTIKQASIQTCSNMAGYTRAVAC
jgi:hypothetical protein